MNNNEAQEFKRSMERVSKAHDELLRKLFGCVPDCPGDYTITRQEYTKAMKDIQEEFGLVEGDPDLVLFVLEQIARSPRFDEDYLKKIGAESNGRKATMGTTVPCTANGGY